MTAGAIVLEAAKALGKMGAGRQLSTSEVTDGVATLAGLIDSWNARSVFVHTTSGSQYTFNTSKTAYTIGPSAGDWNAARPTWIDRANLVMTDSSPYVYVPIGILDYQGWAALTVRDVYTGVPRYLYYEDDFPIGTLNFWGKPRVGDKLELWVPEPLDVPVLAATDLLVPPGYRSAMVYGLAELLSAQWGVPLPPMVVEQARRARAAVQSLNTRAPHVTTADSGLSAGGTRPYFNYKTGDLL